MRSLFSAKPTWLSCLPLLVIVLTVAGCATQKVKPEPFQPFTPYSKKLPGSGEVVCWAVKRAFLSQGYMMDGSSNSLIMIGTRDTQKDDTDITLRLQATCVDDKDGFSTVFVTAMQEVSKLQKITQSQSYGVSIATITVPTGSEKALRVVKRETIQDPAFYDSFYRLVQHFAEEEKAAR